MSTIAVTIQVGSRGYEIAGQVARRLHMAYVDRQITLSAGAYPVLRAGPSVRVPRARVMSGVAVAQVLGEELPAHMLVADAALLSAAAEQVCSGGYCRAVELGVRRFADRGDHVIAGHGGPLILHDRPDVLKVLVLGTPEARARRLARARGTRARPARAVVKATDAAQALFFARAFDADGFDPHLYDFVIDSDLTDPVQAAALIAAAAAGRGTFRAPASARASGGR